MDAAIHVEWIKGVGGGFLDLLLLDLRATYFTPPKSGVYVIWYTGPAKAPVIKIGQGNIHDRLMIERVSPQITQFSSAGQLKVSWIIIDSGSFDGVEAYLYDYYKPLVGERKKVERLIPVTPLLSL